MRKSEAAQRLARMRFDAMTEEQKEAWKQHCRAIAKKPRKRLKKAKK